MSLVQGGRRGFRGDGRSAFLSAVGYDQAHGPLDRDEGFDSDLEVPIPAVCAYGYGRCKPAGIDRSVLPEHPQVSIPEWRCTPPLNAGRAAARVPIGGGFIG